MADIPFDGPGPDSNLVLTEDWWAFKAGTPRKDICHYFNNHHSKRILYLTTL